MWDAEKHFADFQAGNPTYVSGSRGNSITDPETGMRGGKVRDSTDMVETMKEKDNI